MKVERLISIIMVLLEKNRIRSHDLAEMFEVSPRTIYRDIESITIAGIPIRSIPVVGGGFEIMPQYKLDKNVFSTNDLSTLIMGLSALSNMTQKEDVTHTMTKIASLVPTKSEKEVNIKSNQLHIDLTPWMANKNIKPHIEIVKEAIDKMKLLSFDYLDRYGNQTYRTVESYQLILKGNHWYWSAFCYKRNDFRLFRLSRASHLNLSCDNFCPRDYSNPSLNFDDILTSLQITITLRIESSIAYNVLEYCDYDNFSKDGDNHFIVEFPFIENDYYYTILLGFGDKCECLKPLHVREALLHRVERIMKVYEKCEKQLW